jgi:hypothetical protein
MSGVRVSHLGPKNEKNRQEWRFFCVWPAKVVDRGVKMHIYWMNNSKPLEMLDISSE